MVNLTIYDSYGDGICCVEGEGSYSLYVNDELIGSGGDFGYSESHSFGSCEPSSVPSSKPSPVMHTAKVYLNININACDLSSSSRDKIQPFFKDQCKDLMHSLWDIRSFDYVDYCANHFDSRNNYLEFTVDAYEISPS